ncbi:muts domain V-domain-containing protein [Trametes punicea]|nr:muts domain V-domain-containing protein [Trametes punicea]
MLALFHRSRQCPPLICSPRELLILKTTRRLASSDSRRTADDDATAGLKKPNVTRKKYSELPASRVLADGAVVPPLPDWHGGLRESMALYKTLSSTLTENASPASERSDLSIESLRSELDAGLSLTRAGNPRKRRAKVTQSSEESSVGSAAGASPVGVEDIATPKVKTRGRKRNTAVQPPQDSEIPPPSTPLANEILDNLARYPHCILLTRVGQFYESYFDQAAEVSRLLNIKLTKKTWSGQRILMCGFPLMHLNKYLKMLVQDHNRFVAMCEEFPRTPALGAKGGFNRRVVRIVTPGTLIDEPFLNPYENNYLLSVVPAPSPSPPTKAVSDTNASGLPVGLAWIDVSTGEFYTKSTTFAGLRDELVRIGPKEVVLDRRLSGDSFNPAHRAVIEEGCFVSYFAPSETPAADTTTLASARQESPDDLTSDAQFPDGLLPVPLTEEETRAVELLTAFMHANLMEHMPSLASPTREMSSGRMQIDSHTVKALEIREGLREGGTTGSLLSVIKRTVTTSGTRLLARWLCSPSTSVAEINARQSLVAFFYAKPFLRQDLVQLLRDAEDATRIVQKFLLGRGNFFDLSAICTTIDIWASIKEKILTERKMEQLDAGSVDHAQWSSIDALMDRLSDLSGLAGKIRAALAQREAAIAEGEELGEDLSPGTSPMQSRDPRNPLGLTEWIIKPEFSEHLTKLHATLQSLLTQKDQLEHRLQTLYDAPSLTLRASPGQGMHVHVARKNHASKLKNSEEFITLSESGSTCSFFNREWSQLAAQISETTFAISLAEKEAFDLLRSEVTAHSHLLRRNARIIDELDVTLAFANLAIEMRFVRPNVTEGSAYHVVNGRHPTVELGLLTSGRAFTPNTVTFTPDSRLHIVTGPNMAGKSTLLRQTALIAILAQTGSFVPAEHAEIGVVDRVFSRVGAKDDLFRDRSTFMVEMLEASDILRRATSNSLVIMDEVGRGTTVEDGLAIAFATAHHLLTVNGCRAMFATHFHELTDMLGYDPVSHKGQGPFAKVAFYCTDVDETENGFFAYSHRLRPGVNRDSHGLKVAQFAGMPESAIQVARSALVWLKERSAERVNRGHQLHTLGQALASEPT